MGLLEFDKLPINTLVGADWDTFKKVTDRQSIDKEYQNKYYLTKGVCRLLSLLNPIEEKYYRKLADKPLEADPLFILGHWRSGTTFVHNVLACDKHFGYTTTYQTVFPHLMLWGQPFFKKNMSFLMPDKRPTDNMELKVDLPQEEEFALSNMLPYSYYNFWFFPQRMLEYCDRYLTFDAITEQEREVFKKTFMKLVKISLWNTQGAQFLSKNPPHTGRIKTLLEMFPNAKFIYLKRNPYTVFESTRSFFTNTIKPLKLQNISNEELEHNFVEVYKRLFYKYQEQKHLIPKGNLVEIKFEDFEKDAFAMTEDIYNKLNLSSFNESKPYIEKYLDKKKGYKKNQYKYEDKTIRVVEENWGMALKEWGYDL
ncbi:MULTISPECIES: sulfotransferase family protein [Parabacteroides]|uniref:Sulfotransferase family protein n=1 Tax=Parabacteroides chinchillae TaxID=871327 RepID=A0A8G2BYL2_9BACT|nr:MULTISPECIES: sulfotransferase [Parabacteroides]SEG20852.1 Sulfotransferase family protein [Parabacteroides chinchillae]